MSSPSSLGHLPHLRFQLYFTLIAFIVFYLEYQHPICPLQFFLHSQESNLVSFTPSLFYSHNSVVWKTIAKKKKSLSYFSRLLWEVTRIQLKVTKWPSSLPLPVLFPLVSILLILLAPLHAACVQSLPSMLSPTMLYASNCFYLLLSFFSFT